MEKTCRVEERSSRMEIVWVHPGIFLQRVRRALKRKELSCRAQQKTARKSKRAEKSAGVGGPPLHCFFVSIDSKGVAEGDSVSIHSKEVRRIMREAEKMVGRREAGGKRRPEHAAG